MSYKHGIEVLENPTSIIPPIESDASVQVVFGTAPINLAENPYESVNKPILLYSWEEGVKNFGYSDDWESYTLCQSMDATFKILNVAPVIFVNVLDPARHKKSVEKKVLTVSKGEVKILEEGILLNTIKVEVNNEQLEKETDYMASFDRDGYVVVALLGDHDEIEVSYEKLDPSKVTELDVVGGYDVTTGKYEGLEVIDQVYPRLGIVPGQALAPGWSHKPVIGIVLDAKTQGINTNFNAMNLLDIDSETVISYQDVPAWKNDNSYTSKQSIVCFPKCKIGDKVYWMSALIAALIQRTDAVKGGGVPYVSPSNERLPITGAIVGKNTELSLDQGQANFLNGAGIITVINLNGWRSWGNNTAAYPSTSDVKERFIAVRRMFNWWGNTFILTYFDKVDDPTNYRLIDSVVDSENIRANGFKALGQIAGAKIEFRQDQNPITSLLNGKIQFIQKMAAFTPAEHIVNVLEFDPRILEESLFGGD